MQVYGGLTPHRMIEAPYPSHQKIPRFGEDAGDGEDQSD